MACYLFGSLSIFVLGHQIIIDDHHGDSDDEHGDSDNHDGDEDNDYGDDDDVDDHGDDHGDVIASSSIERHKASCLSLVSPMLNLSHGLDLSQPAPCIFRILLSVLVVTVVVMVVTVVVMAMMVVVMVLVAINLSSNLPSFRLNSYIQYGLFKSSLILAADFS